MDRFIDKKFVIIRPNFLMWNKSLVRWVLDINKYLLDYKFLPVDLKK